LPANPLNDLDVLKLPHKTSAIKNASSIIILSCRTQPTAIPLGKDRSLEDSASFIQMSTHYERNQSQQRVKNDAHPAIVTIV
jgi:hypothetical protein